LVLGWCLWLIGTWVVLAMTLGWARQTGGIGWNPSFRWMVFSAMVGLMGVWPAIRLSQSPAFPAPLPTDDQEAHFRGRGWRFPALLPVLWDWVALNVVFQAVLWPMKVLSQWSVVQSLWLVGALLAWSLLTGLVIAWGRCYPGAWMRTAAMVACVGIVLAEPVLLAVGSMVRGDVADVQMRLSPVQTLWALAGRPAMYSPAPWAFHVVAVGAAALLGWAVLGVLRGRGD
jgi:hypothetical protein